jgi:hypothetical protein
MFWGSYTPLASMKVPQNKVLLREERVSEPACCCLTHVSIFGLAVASTVRNVEREPGPRVELTRSIGPWQAPNTIEHGAHGRRVRPAIVGHFGIKLRNGTPKPVGKQRLIAKCRCQHAAEGLLVPGEAAKTCLEAIEDGIVRVVERRAEVRQLVGSQHTGDTPIAGSEQSLRMCDVVHLA